MKTTQTNKKINQTNLYKHLKTNKPKETNQKKPTQTGTQQNSQKFGLDGSKLLCYF